MSTIRKRAEGLAMSSLLRGLSAAGKVLPHANMEAQGIEVLRDVPYVAGGGAARTLDVYRPQGRGPFPTVLYIHGGGFRISSKPTHRGGWRKSPVARQVPRGTCGPMAVPCKRGWTRVDRATQAGQVCIEDTSWPW